MNFGKLLIVLAAASSITATVSYLLAEIKGKKKFLHLGKTAYIYFTIFTLVAAAFLFYLFLSKDYSYKYVYQYSSSDLPFFFLLSAFWAGQQGTYLLWMALLSLTGFYIMFRGREYRPLGMFYLGLVQAFFWIILMALSPFDKFAMARPDGAGLNALLVDYWMVIHPPVMFAGFAAVAIPAVLAMAALTKRKFDNWSKIAFAPAAMAATFLAAGNIMGGFWAYKTLGWGGYWAWDPVENSSFVPWMFTLALMHGFILERNDGAMKKTNLFLAMFGLMLVTYGTFLTRSGVLADFSVHSFVDLGINQYLIGFMTVIALIIIGLMVFRTRDIKAPTVIFNATSKQFALIVSIWLLSILGLFVLFGTSWPLISTIMGKPAAVDTVVYTRVALPLTIIVGIFLGISPYMIWKGGESKSLLRKIIPAAALALVVTLIAAYVGVHRVSYLMFVYTVALALFSNLHAVIQAIPNRFRHAGAQISHFGLSLMLLGILGSSSFDDTQKLVLDRDDSGQAFGYQFVYHGTAGAIQTPNNEVYLTVATNEGTTFDARPKLFWDERMQGMMKKPAIHRRLLYDLYMAPEQIQDLSDMKTFRLAKGESAQRGDFDVKFIGFDQQGHGMDGPVKFGAILEVSRQGAVLDTVIPAQAFVSGQTREFDDAAFTAGNDTLNFRLDHIYADQGAVSLVVDDNAEPLPSDRLIMEVSRKPTMNILWTGTILVIFGGVVSFGKRYRIAKTMT